MLNMFFAFSGKVISLQSLFERRCTYKGKSPIKSELKCRGFSNDEAVRIEAPR